MSKSLQTESVLFETYMDHKIDAVTPSLGPISGATRVTVHGTFFNAKTVTFKFGSRKTECMIPSPSQALCSTPQAYVGGQVQVRVWHKGNSSRKLAYLYMINTHNVSIHDQNTVSLHVINTQCLCM